MRFNSALVTSLHEAPMMDRSEHHIYKSRPFVMCPDANNGKKKKPKKTTVISSVVAPVKG